MDDDDKSTELADATVVAAYGKCEWQKPKNNQKVGCYQEPIFRSTEATNGGIVNNLSKVWKSCDCRGNLTKHYQRKFVNFLIFNNYIYCKELFI